MRMISLSERLVYSDGKNYNIDSIRSRATFSYVGLYIGT